MNDFYFPNRNPEVVTTLNRLRWELSGAERADVVNAFACISRAHPDFLETKFAKLGDHWVTEQDKEIFSLIRSRL